MRTSVRLGCCATCAALMLFMTHSAFAAEGPYGGNPASIPGTVQAENYDTGGQGVAYNVTSINGTANNYRSDGVDLEVTSDTGGGYNLGWTAQGQWFKYTVNVATATTYLVTFRVAAINAVTDAFHIANFGDKLNRQHQRAGDRRLAKLDQCSHYDHSASRPANPDL
jgi:hypothetical protein